MGLQFTSKDANWQVTVIGQGTALGGRLPSSSVGWLGSQSYGDLLSRILHSVVDFLVVQLVTQLDLWQASYCFQSLANSWSFPKVSLVTCHLHGLTAVLVTDANGVVMGRTWGSLHHGFIVMFQSCRIRVLVMSQSCPSCVIVVRRERKSLSHSIFSLES